MCWPKQHPLSVHNHFYPDKHTCTTECHKSFMALSPARSMSVSMLSTYHSSEGRKLQRTECRRGKELKSVKTDQLPPQRASLLSL